MYDHVRKGFALLSLFGSALSLLVNAPFGRFAPKDQTSRLLIDGTLSWILMESVAPVAFLCFADKLTLLPILYLTHYLNRAFLSPLRTPLRSKAHLVVPISGALFNLTNAYLLASFFNTNPLRPAPVQFYAGLFLFLVGFAGNISHDQVLLNLRRTTKQPYAIPHGGLYSLVSFPNYLCEWLEWLGFALASSPLPSNPFTIRFFTAPPSLWAPSLTPPWIFLINEILVMLPRAYRGHQWYHLTFPESYPKQRKAIIPFVL